MAAPDLSAPADLSASDKTPRLTDKQVEVLRLLSDGRVRKATTKTSPTTDEVNGTTAGSMVAYGYVQGEAVPGHTLYKITTKGQAALQSITDKKAMLQAKKAAAPAADGSTGQG